MTPEEIVEKLKTLNARQVSRETDIPYDRIAKWIQGKGKPKFADSAVLEDYFENGTSSRGGSQGMNSIPFYNVDFVAGTLELYDDSVSVPEYYIEMPDFKGCVAFRAYSDSMEEIIKSGSILFASKVNDWKSHLEYGQIYGIILHDNKRYLKYIRKSKTPSTHFIFRSHNDAYDDMDVPIAKVKSIWLIEGWLTRRT